MDYDVGQHEQVNSCVLDRVQWCCRHPDTQSHFFNYICNSKWNFLLNFFLFLIFFFFFWMCTPGRFDVNVATRLVKTCGCLITIAQSARGIMNVDNCVNFFRVLVTRNYSVSVKQIIKTQGPRIFTEYDIHPHVYCISRFHHLQPARK